MTRFLRFAAALLLVMLPLCAAGQTYFCTRDGARLTYRRTTVRDGATKWVNEWTIGASRTASDGSRTVSYTVFQKDAKGKSKMKAPVRLSVGITPEGDVLMDLSQSALVLARAFLPKAEISAHGKTTVLPSSMKPGDRLPDASVIAGYAKLSYSANVMERKVLRRETINTPAGSFDCIVISEHKVEKAPAFSRVTTALSWYSDGIGLVRHDTYDKDMKLETSEVLVSVR